MHKAYAAVKPLLADKQPRPVRFKTPLEYPSLAGKYQATINYTENTARSCMHCHQIRDAERLFYRSSREPMPDAVLFPYPDPNVLGLTMDPREMATIARVAPGSVAERAGLQKGDALVSLAGQPLLSIADLQWVLQNTPATAELAAEVRRDGKTLTRTLDLPAGWRDGDISWRTTTWDLRRMALGGMRLDDLDDEHRREAKLAATTMALSRPVRRPVWRSCPRQESRAPARRSRDCLRRPHRPDERVAGPRRPPALPKARRHGVHHRPPQW